MEFFAWLNIPQYVLQFIAQEADSPEIAAEIFRKDFIICLIVAAGLFAVGLVMGGIGLMKMAKKEGVKHGWLGFIPFANTYLAGKIAGEANFFGQKMKRAGLYALLLEIVYSGLEIFLIVLNFLLAKPEYYTLTESAYTAGQYYWTLDSSKVTAAGNEWQYLANQYCNIISYLVWFMVLIFFCVLFIALFRKYYARSPMLMTFLCTLLPFRGFTLFAVRNNSPVDYSDYIRRRAEEYARRNNPYGPYGGYGQGGYGSNNTPPQGGYGQGGYGQSAPPQEDPFSEFGGSGSGSSSSNGPDDPFSDF